MTMMRPIDDNLIKLHSNDIFRADTPSEATRVEQDAHKEDAKRMRNELRRFCERRKPGYFNDYVMNMTLTSSQGFDQSEMPFCASNITLSRIHHKI